MTNPHEESIDRIRRTLLFRVSDITDQAASEEFFNRYCPSVLEWCHALGVSSSGRAEFLSRSFLTCLVEVIRTNQFEPTPERFREWLTKSIELAIAELLQTWNDQELGSIASAAHHLVVLTQDQSIADLVAILRSQVRDELNQIES